jgi:hypothetical protein
MKKVALLLVVALFCSSALVFAQEPYTADTTSIMSSTPSSIVAIVDDGGRILSAQPSRSTSNILHQGTSSVTITFTPNSQSQLAALQELWVWTGIRLYKPGQTNPLGDLDWGGNVNDWGSLTNTGLRMTRSGNNWTLTINDIRRFYNVAAGRQIARLSFVARTQAQPSPCNQPTMRCNQTNNREFSFTTATITSVRQSDEFVTSVSAAPNPFAEAVHLYYNLAKSGNVSMKIFNAMGMEVKTLLLNEFGRAGANVIAWYGDDNAGTPVPSGVYHYRIEMEGTIQTGKITLNR